MQLIRLSGEALEAPSGSGGMTMGVPVMDGLLSVRATYSCGMGTEETSPAHRRLSGT